MLASACTFACAHEPPLSHVLAGAWQRDRLLQVTRRSRISNRPRCWLIGKGEIERDKGRVKQGSGEGERKKGEEVRRR